MLLSDDQLHELYEINDDPKRKEFLDDLFSFMQKRGTPINRLPIMAKSVLDLYELYNLVIARGGLVDVINKKLWQEIIKGLHLPSSITSAAFTLRTQYMKYLYPYECEKKNLSTPAELQAAIDGNRREGRRSSYGQFEAMHTQLQMPQMPRPPSGMQQMSPLALVTHANQQTAAAAAAAAAHHRLMAPPLGQMPNIVTHELEQRMMEYLKLFQQKEARRSQSPEITPREALNALEMSRVALWSMYHNNTSPPSSVNASPVEPQREALNLSDSPPNIPMKRERENSEPPHSDREDFNQPPPLKKSISSSLHDLTIQQQQQQQQQQQHQHNQHQLHSSHHQQQQQSHNQQQQHHNDNQQIHHNQRNKHRNDEHFDDDDIDNEDDDGDMNSRHHNHGMDEDDDIDNNHDDDDVDLRMHHSNLVDTHLGTDNGQTHLNGHLVNSIRKSPPSSPIKPLHNGHHQNDEFSIMSGMQFKITRRGNGANGEQQLVVNLDLNGIHYEGILFANPLPSMLSTTTTNPGTNSPSNITSTANVTTMLPQSPIKNSTATTTTTVATKLTAMSLTPTTNSTIPLLSPPSSSSSTSNNHNLITNATLASPSTNTSTNRSIQSIVAATSATEDILNGGGGDGNDENSNMDVSGVSVTANGDSCSDDISEKDCTMAQTVPTTTTASLAQQGTTTVKTLEDRLHAIVSSQVN